MVLTYKAVYRLIDHKVHAEILDFPGAITCGSNLDEVRQLLLSAKLDLANLAIEREEPLPLPDPRLDDDDVDLIEPIYLHLSASF